MGKIEVVALIHGRPGAYGISFPDFPGAISGGASLEEAVKRGEATLRFHVDGLVADGDPMPAVRSLDAVLADPALAEDLGGAVPVLVHIDDPPAQTVRTQTRPPIRG